MTTAQQGAQAKWCVEPGASPHTFDTSSEPYEFIRESLRRQGETLQTGGVRGTRSRSEEVTRPGLDRVGGPISFNPSPADLDLWLPRILGAAGSSGTFALAETLPTFGILIDRVTQTHEYTDCVVNKATFRAQAGGLLELELDLFGKTEVTGTTYPSLSLGIAANNAPYTFSELTLTLEGAERDTLSLEIVIDNQIDVRFSNSNTATSLTAKDRIITCKTVHPYIAALYATMQAQSGTTASAKFTNAGMSTTFSFASLISPPQSPAVEGKQEITLEIAGEAFKSGGTENLIVTHDSVA